MNEYHWLKLSINQWDKNDLLQCMSNYITFLVQARVKTIIKKSCKIGNDWQASEGYYTTGWRRMAPSYTLYCIHYNLTYGIQNNLHEDFLPLDCVENEMVTRTLSLKAKVSYSVFLGVASVNSTWLGIIWPSITFWSIFSGRGGGYKHKKHNVYCYITRYNECYNIL